MGRREPGGHVRGDEGERRQRTLHAGRLRLARGGSRRQRPARADVIEIPGGIYQLSLIGPVEENFSQTGDLDVLESVEIRGDPFNPVTIIGDGTDRVLHMIGLGTAVYEVSHVTITGGGAVSSGGGLRVSGFSFTLRDSTIEGNTTLLGDGGGLLLGALRSATVRNCTIASNSAPNGVGGGVYATAIGAFDSGALLAGRDHRSDLAEHRKFSGKLATVTLRGINGQDFLRPARARRG